MVSKEPRDDRVVHHGFVGLVLEIAFPARSELWARPFIHLIELFFIWTDLDTRLDTTADR